MAARLPFIVRHRRALIWGALALLALLFGIHVFRWHAPYRLGGAAGEWPLLAGAVAIGVATRMGLPVLSPRFAGASALPAAVVAGTIGYLVLQGADPFAAKRDWRYAPRGCDFALDFPSRPDFLVGEIESGAGARNVERAVHVDVGRGIALSAECVPLERPPGADSGSVLADRAEALLRLLAQRLRLKVGTVVRLGGDTVALSGVADEGRTADNEKLLRKGEARAVVGTHSLLVVWAWRVTRDPAADSGGEAAALFASIRSVARP